VTKSENEEIDEELMGDAKALKPQLAQQSDWKLEKVFDSC
jgi:hypothetical protein